MIDSIKTEKTILVFEKESADSHRTHLKLVIEPTNRVATFTYGSIEGQATMPVPVMSLMNFYEFFTSIAGDTQVKTLIQSLIEEAAAIAEAEAAAAEKAAQDAALAEPAPAAP